MGDRGKGGDGAEPPRQGHCHRQRAMAAHRVARDRLLVHVEREMAVEKFRQLLSDVIPHLKMRCPWLLGCIHVKAGALSQIIGVIIGHPLAARGGIGEDHRDSVFGGPGLCACLGHCVFMCAGQTGEKPQPGHGPLAGFAGLEQRKGHVAGAGAGTVGIDALNAAKAGIF